MICFYLNVYIYLYYTILYLSRKFVQSFLSFKFYHILYVQTFYVKMLVVKYLYVQTFYIV
jgi:hypothetical protein